MDELELLERFRSEVGRPAAAVRARAERAWAVDTSARSSRRRSRSSRRLGVRVVIALAVVGVVVSGVVLVVNHALDQRVADIPRVSLAPGALHPVAAGHLPQNVLVMGMDTRTDDPGAAPFRSDTMILLRVRRHGAEAVWFPRDLLVDIPGHGPDRINQAVALGGPSLAVDTLRRNFGIRVDHYAEIDMDAVPAMVDAVGGVRLDFPEPVRDDLSGFATGAGCRALDGRDATALARSRNMQALRGGTWSTIDTAADLDRAARQQSLIRALTTAVHAEVDRHPTRLLHLVDVVLEHIRVDSTLDRGGALTLARALLGVGGRTLEVTTLPVALPPGSPAYVIPAEGSDAVIAGVGGSRSRRAAPAVAVSDAGRYAPC